MAEEIESVEGGVGKSEAQAEAQAQAGKYWFCSLCAFITSAEMVYIRTRMYFFPLIIYPCR